MDEATSESNNSGKINESEDEVWIETHTETGKAYYYNSKTRQTSWEKPENVKIVTQSEIVRNALKNQPNNTNLENGMCLSFIVNACALIL